MVFIQDIVRGTELTIILSTSQAGLRRAAPSNRAVKAGDQPSCREPSPFGGCNFLSREQDAPRVFLCYKNTHARGCYSETDLT